MTKITSKLKRQVTIPDMESPINITMTPYGMEACIPGCKTKLIGTWSEIFHSLRTPHNIPSYLVDKPMDFLKFQAKKHPPVKEGD